MPRIKILAGWVTGGSGGAGIPENCVANGAGWEQRTSDGKGKCTTAAPSEAAVGCDTRWKAGLGGHLEIEIGQREAFADLGDFNRRGAADTILVVGQDTVLIVVDQAV